MREAVIAALCLLVAAVAAGALYVEKRWPGKIAGAIAKLTNRKEGSQ